MPLEIRPSKPDDSFNIQRAIDLIYDTMQNSGIEPTLWSGALFFCLMEGHKQSGFPFEGFKKEMQQACEHYKEHYNHAD